MVRQRSRRVAVAIKEAVSQLLLEEMKDPRIGFVSIVDVEVSDDLRHANIYASVLGSDEEQHQTMQGLQAGQGFVRSRLGEMLRLRYTPEITFHLDDSIEHGAHISRLIKRLHEDGDG